MLVVEDIAARSSSALLKTREETQDVAHFGAFLQMRAESRRLSFLTGFLVLSFDQCNQPWRRCIRKREDLLCRLVAIDSWHAQVQDDRVRIEPSDGSERFVPTPCRLDTVPFESKRERDRLCDIRVVIDDENATKSISSAGRIDF